MTAQATKPTKPVKRKPRGKKALRIRPDSKVAAIIGAKLADPTLNTHQIAVIAKSDSGNVSRTLRKYKIAEFTEDFKERRADILADLQARIIKSITAGDIKEAKLRDRVVSAGVLYDKERLERGLSTENIAYDGRNITASIDQIRAELEKLKVGDGEVIEAESGTD